MPECRSAYGAAARMLRDTQLHQHVANLPRVPGYYEVGLTDPETMRMFRVGTLSEGSGDELLSMPSNTTTSPPTPATVR
ncbi:hypothetical protein GA0070613_0471 [Micromonospora inositola]|uniref:Uncharacterized protein n=1 Tax=Micromonospora inositola TaxID=47865 RepID=A0A1C5GWQ5_9ACTN|nr:hypothetical protein GA0070613_0471 [Micromonospora inositola]